MSQVCAFSSPVFVPISEIVMFRQPSLWFPTLSYMNALTAFGLFAVTAMVVCYALEHRHPSFILLFAFSCVLGSVYGFLQGAWPFGLVELVWSVLQWQGGDQVTDRKPALRVDECDRDFSTTIQTTGRY